MASNAEWVLLGQTIAECASIGARPWELRLLALKGGRASMRDIARIAVRHRCDASAPTLIPKGDGDGNAQ